MGAIGFIGLRVDFNPDIAAHLDRTGQVVSVGGAINISYQQNTSEARIGQGSPRKIRRDAIVAVKDKILMVQRSGSAVAGPFGLSIETQPYVRRRNPVEVNLVTSNIGDGKKHCRRQHGNLCSYVHIGEISI